MIETLVGTRETVHHKTDTHVRLYVNDECEHYPPHWHNDMEILCPLSGSYTATCPNGTYVLRPGDLLIIGARTIHDLPAEPQGVRLIFQINWTPLREINGLETALSRLSPCCLITPESFPDIHRDVHRVMLEIRDLYLQSPLLTEASIYARAMEMITLISRSRKSLPEPDDTSCSRILRHNESMQQICDYLASHCAENISLDDAAALAGFSKYYFERLFRDYTDMSFHQYLIVQRISLSEKLLTDPRMPITEIALRSGFSTSAAFSKAFRQAKGSTPSEFRKLQTGQEI